MPDLADLAGRIDNTLARLASGPGIDVATDVPLVSFSFDDVPETALTAGATVLERNGARGTFYVAGGLVGTGESGRLITPEGVRNLYARGHEIGDHTFSHRPLGRLGRHEVAREFARNAAFLRDIDPGIVPRNMAFPYNRSSLAATPELRRRFRSARGGRAGINRQQMLPFHLRAVEIAPQFGVDALSRWIDDVAARPGWLVFFTHDVADRPTPYGTSAATLERLVQHARDRGCLVLTVDAALDRIGVPPAAA